MILRNPRASPRKYHRHSVITIDADNIKNDTRKASIKENEICDFDPNRDFPKRLGFSQHDQAAVQNGDHPEKLGTETTGNLGTFRTVGFSKLVPKERDVM
jgi:hypothetical protein